MAVTKLCTYIETLFTDVGYIFTNVSNGCDKNWIRELIKMSQTLLMFSLMLQPLLIQYVSNGCDKIAVKLFTIVYVEKWKIYSLFLTEKYRQMNIAISLVKMIISRNFCKIVNMSQFL